MLMSKKIIRFDEIKHGLLDKKNIKLSIARLDLIHPVISGNKLFKLHYFLEKALQSPHKTMITFGGAYSNHLVATAYAGSKLALKTIGYVRGESPAHWSQTLKDCRDLGMELRFESRTDYKRRSQNGFLEDSLEASEAAVIIPEGGYHPLGARGAALIMQQLQHIKATHVCTAVGTATTLAGLLLAADIKQQLIAIPVLKNMHDITERLRYLTGSSQYENLRIWDQYHFGGYAKHSEGLLSFMNDFYIKFSVPLDIVYTAKMMAGVMDKINNNYFSEGDTVVCLHTGGLQGNGSLPIGSLIF